MRLPRKKFSPQTRLILAEVICGLGIFCLGCSSPVVGPDRTSPATQPGLMPPVVANTDPAGSSQAMLPPNAIAGPTIQIVPDGIELPHVSLDKMYQPKSTDDAQYHEVQSGDTLSSIARRYGQSTGVIERANGLENQAPLVPGQQLFIPKSK
ncbi:MAG: LysM peptidoglycan-binding domain-containing protein [Planctomycetes bacterium]|nr:LysM peptidoglycan-binding domain-containing protein [Planctomycetota bacterium]